MHNTEGQAAFGSPPLNAPHSPPVADGISLPAVRSIEARRERRRARTRVAGSVGFSVLLLSLAALTFAALRPRAFAVVAGIGLLGVLGGSIFGAVVSAVECWRGARVEALVHGFNSIVPGLALTGGIVTSSQLGHSTPLWLGYAAFLPVAFGNVICSAVAGFQARKLDWVERDRTLRNTLSATAAIVAVGYSLLASLLSLPAADVATAHVVIVMTAATFLIAFLISCRAVKIVNRLRRDLRRNLRQD